MSHVLNVSQATDIVQDNTIIKKEPVKKSLRLITFTALLQHEIDTVCQQTYFYTKTQFKIKTRFNCLNKELQLESIYSPFIKIRAS